MEKGPNSLAWRRHNVYLHSNAIGIPIFWSTTGSIYQNLDPPPPFSFSCRSFSPHDPPSQPKSSKLNLLTPIRHLVHDLDLCSRHGLHVGAGQCDRPIVVPHLPPAAAMQPAQDTSSQPLAEHDCLSPIATFLPQYPSTHPRPLRSPTPLSELGGRKPHLSCHRQMHLST